MTLRYFQSLPNFNRRFVLAMAGLILLLAAALTAMVINPPKGQRIWRIAVNDWPGSDPLHLAAEKGMFAEHGLTIQLVPINTIIDMRTAFERNLIDAYTAPLVDVVESMQTTGVPAHIVMALDYSNGGDKILANPAIPHPTVLGDARVGIETSSAIGRYLMARALQDTPLQHTAIRLVQASQPGLVEMAISGKLDALVTYHPYADKILSRRDMRVIFSSADIPSEIMDVMAVSPFMREEEPDLSLRLQQVWQQALEYSARNPSETALIHARRYGITPAEYQEMLRGITPITPADMQALMQSGRMADVIHQATRILTPDTPLTAAQMSATLAITPYRKGRP